MADSGVSIRVLTLDNGEGATLLQETTSEKEVTAAPAMKTCNEEAPDTVHTPPAEKKNETAPKQAEVQDSNEKGQTVTPRLAVVEMSKPQPDKEVMLPTLSESTQRSAYTVPLSSGVLKTMMKVHDQQKVLKGTLRDMHSIVLPEDFARHRARCDEIDQYVVIPRSHRISRSGSSNPPPRKTNATRKSPPSTGKRSSVSRATNVSENHRLVSQEKLAKLRAFYNLEEKKAILQTEKEKLATELSHDLEKKKAILQTEKEKLAIEVSHDLENRKALLQEQTRIEELKLRLEHACFIAGHELRKEKLEREGIVKPLALRVCEESGSAQTWSRNVQFERTKDGSLTTNGRWKREFLNVAKGSEMEQISRLSDKHTEWRIPAASSPDDMHLPDKHTEWRLPRKIKTHL